MSASRRSRGPGGVAIALATLAANFYLVVGGCLFGSLALAVSWVPPRGSRSFWFARAWAKGLLLASGVRVRVEPTPPEAGSRVVFMANHQSLYDIAVLLATVPVPVCFLAKRSLFRIPVFGWALAAVGFVPVDRTDRSRAREAFVRALAGLDRGAAIVVFPEETRSLDGRMRPFRRGGFLMALKGRAPIVPVGIRGTLQVRARGRLVVRPGEVQVAYGDPVQVEDFGLRRKQELIGAVESEVARLAGAVRVRHVENEQRRSAAPTT